MKKGLIAVSRYGFLLAILLFGGWYLSNNYDRFALNAHFTVSNVSILVLLNLATIFCESLRLKLQIKKLGHTLSIPRAWHILTVLQAMNHVILKAGTFSAGYYISKKYRLSFHAYCAFVITYVVVMVLASGVFGLLVTLAYIAFGAQVSLILPLFFSGVIACCAGFIALASLNLPLPRLPGIVTKLLSSWREIYSDYSMISSLLLVELFYFLTCSLRFMVAVSMFSMDMRFLDAVTVLTVGNFLRVVSIVPGGMGVAEVASAWISGLTGNDAGIAGLSAGLDRLVYVVLIMLFGGIGFLTLSGRKEFHRPSEEEME